MQIPIQLTLTHDEYSTLMRLVFMGDWIINNDHSEPQPKFDAVVQAVWAQGHDAGMTTDIEFDAFSKEYSPSIDLDVEMIPIVEEYNDSVFWDELIDRLSLRDLLKEHTMEELAAMSHEERMRIRLPMLAKYEELFDRVGLDCLRVVDKPGTLIQIS